MKMILILVFGVLMGSQLDARADQRVFAIKCGGYGDCRGSDVIGTVESDDRKAETVIRFRPNTFTQEPICVLEAPVDRKCVAFVSEDDIKVDCEGMDTPWFNLVCVVEPELNSITAVKK